MTYRLSNQMPNQSRLVDEKKEGKQKFFFVIEGEKTERIYLQEIEKNIKKEALHEIVILERIQGSQSNQFIITSTIKKYLETNNSLTENNKAQLLDLSKKYDEEELTESEVLISLTEILGDAKDSLIIEHNNSIIEQIAALNELSTYEKNFDKICLILDRDYRSFKDFQYDKVIQICEEKNFFLGITNPNFEFYLLLHIDDAKTLDLEKIKTNPNETSKKKYVEYKLNSKMKEFNLTAYKKNCYNANYFIGKYSVFKENILNYTDDNVKLKNEIGSSVHHIINQLLE